MTKSEAAFFRHGIMALALVLAASIAPSSAADAGGELAEQYLKKIPITVRDRSMTPDQAMHVQARFVEALKPSLGDVVGYKAGLTNPDVQKAFGVSQPLRGTLLARMILPSGAEVEAGFGSRPVYEGDLILRVGSAGINSAVGLQEILQHIDAAIPFIELPDLVYAKDIAIDAPALAAVNVGARLGVVGVPIAVQPTPEWMDRLKGFTLRIIDEKGTVIAEGRGDRLLNHPLDVVAWIIGSLKAEGKQLKPGDLLSLGSLTRLIPPAPNTTVRGVYTGLDPSGPVEISVSFK